MCAFVRLLLRRGEGLLSEEAFAQMSTGNPLEDENDAYGYGLLLRDLDGRRFIGHGGGMVGYLAGMQAETDANLGAIVLQNGMGAHPMMLARTVIRIADGEQATPAGAAATSMPNELAGVYEPDAPGCEPIELAASKNGPMLRCDGREIGLAELDDDLFLAPDPAFDRFPIRVERPTDDTPGTLARRPALCACRGRGATAARTVGRAAGDRRSLPLAQPVDDQFQDRPAR